MEREGANKETPVTNIITIIGIVAGALKWAWKGTKGFIMFWKTIKKAERLDAALREVEELREEVASLRAKLAKRDDPAAFRAKYHLQDGAYHKMYCADEGHEEPFCAKCWHTLHEKVSVERRHADGEIRYKCPVCQT